MRSISATEAEQRLADFRMFCDRIAENAASGGLTAEKLTHLLDDDRPATHRQQLIAPKSV
jgi:hypothetical protein